MPVVRFSISLEKDLLGRFDNLINRKGYSSRSEAIRDLIRDSLVKEETGSPDGEGIGVITLVYSHDQRDLTDRLVDLQHDYYALIESTLHHHLDEHNCLEVIVVRGRVREVREMADRLIGTKGVKHGKLVITTPGWGLE
ncbi:MAG: nickel-responsive transcriptional regulator NikR [Deltaproteobacteria bacterium]|nr:MAG: nickel-responsive transcriptional regulator NikR [Deltaproteobacteria bacterium]